MSFDEIKRMFESAPTGANAGELDAAARGWLVELGLGAERSEAPACTLVALMVDEDIAIEVFALPNDVLGDDAHADLAAVSGSGFAWHFNADLAPEQFAGAFRIYGGISSEHDVFEDQIEELREEMGDEAPDLDWDALLKSAGSWNEYRVQSDTTLGPITRLYTARLGT